MKAKKRKVTLLFAEILPQDGTLWQTEAEYVVYDGDFQGLFPGPKPKVDFTSFSEVQVN